MCLHSVGHALSLSLYNILLLSMITVMTRSHSAHDEWQDHSLVLPSTSESHFDHDQLKLHCQIL